MQKSFNLSGINKILCVRTDRIGEFLLTMPAIQQIKAHFPKAKISLLAQKSNITLIREAVYIDNWLEYEKLPRSPWGLASALKKEHFDLAVIFHPHKLFHQAIFLAGIPCRVGYNHKWGFLLNTRLKETQTFLASHEVERNLALIAPLCSTPAAPSISLPWNEQQNLHHILQEHGLREQAPFVVIHPFTSNREKEVPFHFWEKVIRHITSQEHNVIIIGQEQEYRNSLFTAIKNPRVFSLAGRLELRATANLIRHFCRYYIGLDSGPFHMASLSGIPLTVIFRFPNSIRRWGPFFHKETAKIMLYDPKNEESLVRQILIP